jgi:hypothetical protein
MSDAGEVLLAIYGRIEARGEAAAEALATALGLRVHEYVYCTECELESHADSYTQYCYNAQVCSGCILPTGGGCCVGLP